MFRYNSSSVTCFQVIRIGIDITIVHFELSLCFCHFSHENGWSFFGRGHSFRVQTVSIVDDSKRR